jgi:hypothetical protein
MKRLVTLALIFGVAACGGGGGATPGGPGTPPPPPVPSPTPTPNAYAAACGTPLPPSEFAYGFGIKVQLEPTKNKKILNGSPSVRNLQYCEAAGFSNTLICNTRKEDNPQRAPCDHYFSGMSDQGRPGPNWFQDFGYPGGSERLVKCGAPDTTCSLKPEDQYLLDIHEVGRYVACAGVGGSGAGTCGDCIILTMNQSTGSLGGLCKHS